MKWIAVSIVAGLALAALSFALARAGKDLEVGDPAPSFTLHGSDGKTHSLEESLKRHKVVILAWFPKAFTGGWTAECKSLRESGKSIREFDVALFAASIDDPETNEKFAKSLQLDYPILSDPEKDTARAYGVLKGMGMYAARQTFYIGSDGKILYIDRDVKTSTAGADIAKRLDRLGVPKR